MHSGSGSVQGSSVHTVSEYLQGQLLWPLKSGSTVTMVATGWVCIPMVVGSGGHEVASRVAITSSKPSLHTTFGEILLALFVYSTISTHINHQR